MELPFKFALEADQLISGHINALFGTARLIVSGVFGQKRKKLVLVVERDMPTLKLISSLISKFSSHCELVQMSDGPSAFASVCSRPPDLIIANTQLNGINGFRFVDNLKMDIHARKIPLVITTGLTRAALITNLLLNLRPGFPQVR